MSIPHRTIYRARRGGRLVPLAKSITPALRAFPPRKINYARSAGVPSSQNQLCPLCGRSLIAKSIMPALWAFPPRKINYARSAGVPSISIYGEGVADRPGVRSKASARDQNL